MFKQRSVSPLIATILLIVTSVMLITIILTWGQAFTNKKLDQQSNLNTLEPSDIDHYIYPKTFVNGLMQFNYSPPDNIGAMNISINKYKIFFDNNETAEIDLDSSYTLKEGINFLRLDDFDDQQISSKKFTLVLETDDDKYITIKNITNPYPYVPEPPVPQEYIIGPLSPETIINDSSAGDFAWLNPSNAISSNNIYATKSVLSMGGIGAYDESVKIVKSNGVIGSLNKAKPDMFPGSDENITYGGESDLWGENWTASDINDPNFGVAYQSKLLTEAGDVMSHYLKTTNFNFNIPLESTINGIVVTIEKSMQINGNPFDGFTVTAKIDYISVTVYYSV